MGSFPLATLAPEITASGITAPSYSDILNSMIASFRAIFGTDVYLEPDSQEYQWLGVLALAQHDSNQALIAIYQARSPATAQGADLSSLVKINGLARKISSQSIATVTIVGVSGTQIINGIVKDTNGGSWTLPPLVTIPPAGGIDVVATSVDTGAIAAPAGTITTIGTPTLGWQSVTNSADATAGKAIETDAQLRQRQTISTSLPAQTPPQAILAAVSNIDGVLRSALYENSSGAADANGIPGHTIAIVVDGGDPTDVAQIIESKKPPGTGTFGTTSVNVADPAGLPVTINFFNLVDVPVYVIITIRPMAGYTDAMGQELAQRVVDFINSIPIGDSVYYNWLFAPASLNGSINYRVTSIAIDVIPNPVAQADVPIAFNQAAVCTINNITLLVA
jgi:uncharacterized phage protein gp47/JayE